MALSSIRHYGLIKQQKDVHPMQSQTFTIIFESANIVVSTRNLLLTEYKTYTIAIESFVFALQFWFDNDSRSLYSRIVIININIQFAPNNR